MGFVPALAITAFIKKAVDASKYAAAGNLNGLLTQVYAWLAGVLSVLVVAHTTWARTVVVGGHTLHSLDAWSQVFVGLALASGAGVLADGIRAWDNTDSAAIPPLTGLVRTFENTQLTPSDPDLAAKGNPKTRRTAT